MKYSVVWNLVRLDPKYMANSLDTIGSLSGMLVSVVASSKTKKFKSPDSGDSVLQQYKFLISELHCTTENEGPDSIPYE